VGYFDDEKNVREYLKMAEGYDGRELVDRLAKYLPEGSTVLELGMGPGIDLDMLAERFITTGSDTSDIFLDMYRQQHPAAALINLNAVSIDTDRTFDGIYSNKVLHHLTRDELKASLMRQVDVLKTGGIALHSFWHGDKEEEHKGLRFIYYRIEELQQMIPASLELAEFWLYKEMKREDSICLVLRKSKRGSDWL
jgi:trans-aconitate methyltransferase